MTSAKNNPPTYLGLANHRQNYRAFGIKPRDRFSHALLIGRTGTGKSTLLKNMAVQDIANGYGMVLIDPHGDLSKTVRQEAEALSDRAVTYIEGANPNWNFNPLQYEGDTPHAFVAASLVEVFRKIWSEDWGPRLEHLLRNVILTLLETDGATIGEIPRLLADKDYRRDVAESLSDPQVRSFWQDEFKGYSPAFRAVVTAPLLNKIGALLSDQRLRYILTAQESTLSIMDIMDKRGVLLVNLSKGQMGEGPASLLGSFLVSHIAIAGLGRAKQSEHEREPFFLHLDEFHSFSTVMLATMLSELRKYRVGMILAHQYLSQLTREVRDAVIGNMGTMICFRVGAYDASFLAREFDPKFEAIDLLSLPNYHIYLKLMIDGQVSKPFSAVTFPSVQSIPGFHHTGVNAHSPQWRNSHVSKHRSDSFPLA